MGRRTVLLIVAIIVALLGVTLVLLYVRGIDNRAREGQETVEVLYTKSAIALGTTGDAAQKAGAFESRQVPQEAVAEGALSSVAPIESPPGRDRAARPASRSPRSSGARPAPARRSRSPATRSR